MYAIDEKVKLETENLHKKEHNSVNLEKSILKESGGVGWCGNLPWKQVMHSIPSEKLQRNTHWRIEIYDLAAVAAHFRRQRAWN